MKKLSLFFYFLLSFFVFSLSSCIPDSESVTHSAVTPKIPTIESITLTFAGDIMAHDTNFKMKDYSKIYEDLADILKSDDLSFGNIEMPVCDSLPMSNYPRFNVHSPYVEAAINGGFDVLGFANNHTNDQGVVGIDGTLKAIEKFETIYNAEEKKVWFSGLKTNADEQIEPITIEKNGFKIGFLSVTEILNSYDSSKQRLAYSEPTKQGREKLLNCISEYKKNTDVDLFVLMLHLNEAEYGRKVEYSKKVWFKQLEKAGVDIICASHPHVMQMWEASPVLDNEEPTDDTLKAFYLYSMGNFISAQRVVPNYTNPTHYREYTGDAVLLQLTYTKIDGELSPRYSIRTFPITVYNGKDGLVMKQLTDDWIKSLTSERERTYYTKRLELLKEYLPIHESAP